MREKRKSDGQDLNATVVYRPMGREARAYPGNAETVAISFPGRDAAPDVSIEEDAVEVREDGVPTEAQARKLVELMRRGASLEEVSDKTGLSRECLMRNAVIKRYIQEMIQNNWVPPAVQRELVRAARVKVLVNALQEDDKKLILRAAKEIASDPEVGLNAPPSSTVVLNIHDIAEVLDRVSPPPGVILDADVEEISNDDRKRTPENE